MSIKKSQVTVPFQERLLFLEILRFAQNDKYAKTADCHPEPQGGISKRNCYIKHMTKNYVSYTDLHKFHISVHNSTESVNIQIILNIRQELCCHSLNSKFPPIYSKECKYQSYIKHKTKNYVSHTDSHKFHISVHNSTNSAYIKTILNIRHKR